MFSNVSITNSYVLPMSILPVFDETRVIDAVARFAEQGLRLKSGLRGQIVLVPFSNEVRHVKTA